MGLPITWRYIVEGIIRSKQVKKAFVLIDQVLIPPLSHVGELGRLMSVQMIRDEISFSPVLMNIIRTHCVRNGISLLQVVMQLSLTTYQASYHSTRTGLAHSLQAKRRLRTNFR